MAQTVREVMSTDLVTVGVEDSLIDASKLMSQHDIGDVVVVDADRLLGIVTDRDIVVRGLAEGKSPNAPASELATTDVKVLSPEDDAEEAVQWMREAAIRRLPVVEDGKPVGIVSIGDLAVTRDPSSALADISAAEPKG
ncbi:MAG TPA: CBS domain-containing protein [Actinomycetota bacterium]|nr:CBS domain-containing protein [Actinomycetota bacterium]